MVLRDEHWPVYEHDASSGAVSVEFRVNGHRWPGPIQTVPARPPIADEQRLVWALDG